MNLKEIQDITGLPFKTKGNKFIAACYLDGSPHSRPDKVNAKIHDKYGIMISEEGGECMSLKAWVDLYGDGREIKIDRKLEQEKRIERIFVDHIHYESTIPINYSGNLFKFLSDIFGFNTTSEIFLKYNVGENGANETIYWYMNQSNQACHDAIVLYDTDGKRFKKNGGYRKFKVDDGYSGKCAFGSHLIKSDSEVCCVESEKTAIIMAITETKGRIWVATGGSNKISVIREDWKLYPDFDMAGSFWECVSCSDKNGCIIQRIDGKRLKKFGCHNKNKNIVQWFDLVDVMDGDDVGDAVIKLKSGK